MPEREPAVLRDVPAATDTPAEPPDEPARPPPSTSAARGAGELVHVVGFWRRLVAAGIDLAMILPVAVVLSLIAGRLTGVRPPAGFDIWLLVLDNEPAVAMGIGLTVAVGAVYVLVFQILRGRTLGMKVMKLKVIDVYGDPPSPARCVMRTVGYLVGVVTLFLGFIWIGFDAEKRGLHDWIAGTYVIQG